MLEDRGVSGGKEKDLLLQSLQFLWAAKNIEKLKEEMQVGFATLEDPLAWLLGALDGLEGWKGKGQSLPALLVHGLQLWLRSHPDGQPSGLKLKKLQAQVFPILVQCHGNLLNPLIGIYQLHSADRNHLLGHISHVYLKGKFKEAAILSIKLKLQPELELEKMCVPLLLQEKMDLVEAYVENYPDLQQRLLRLLDGWFAPGFQIKEVTRKYHGLSGVRPEKVNHRLLNRMVFRFLDKYQLDPALCPNVVNQRHLGTLRYLLHKRFVEKTMTQENWADHVQSTVQENQWLQEQLVHLLVRYGGPETSARWALHYGLPKDSLPCGVPEEMEKLRTQEREDGPGQTRGDGDARRRRSCYRLPIPRDQILLLTTWEEVQKHTAGLLQSGQVIGVDMEWRPSFGHLGAKTRVSLVQLAIQGHIFLLDMQQLLQPGGREKEEEKGLARFFQALFTDPAITKLGYGMSGDLHNLAATCTAFRSTGTQFCGILDLLAVHEQIRKLPKGPSGNLRKDSHQVDSAQAEVKAQRLRPAERGLSLMVQEVLGRPLDKTEQISNWEKRPLREEQILYAASDAYCLLDVYAKLLDDPAAFGLSYEILVRPKRKENPKDEEKPDSQPAATATESPQEENLAPSPNRPLTSPPAAISVRDFRVVCDNMLQGLGRYLRCLGADVQILENADDHRKAAEIARQEGRVILTSGLPYQTLKSQVGEGRCFQVNCSEKAKDQALRVLEHFQVQVAVSDVFSRCQACNCNRYLKVSKETMARLMKARGHWAGEGSAADGSVATEAATGGSVDDPSPCLDEASLELASRLPACSPPAGQWLEESGLDPELALLPSGRPLQTKGIPAGVLSKEDLTCFYCCSDCGKVFWEGSHFGRLVSQFKEVLDAPEGGRSIYGQQV
ncbi:exonuclease mut-7 homolog isoform X2 [Sceloporus undulatus]|uniref:exonuclease mut-7 homolog isoform X2 n=1 Tax=Sceloporus undulatus TaxID=8520 RepID=UPI001C4A9393|nr:exonuclease mut-7 homolog isoform X2 [Sceloporus undulatus]